jgi:alkylation response protein AidB-like acyl-CoA dehydrogenase
MSSAPDEALTHDEVEARAAFAGRFRTWLDEHAPAKGGPGDFSTAHVVSASTRDEFEARERAAFAVTKQWQRTLFDAGWAGRSWPEEYGGHGAPQWQSDVVATEQVGYGVSTKMLAIALEMVPPVLLEFGTHEQRLEHLPRIVRGDEAWCQLLSEPDAGSDLTNVQTAAVRVPSGWSVSGQKVWTSGATSADFALLLARTDRNQPGRAGVSFFALEMRQPGVDVRPLRQMSGGYHFNEVFLDEAFVPEEGLLGDLGGGFAVLRTMLASERAAIGGGTSARSAMQLRRLAVEMGRDGDAAVRQELARAHTRETVLDLVQARVAEVPAGGSITKLLYSEHGRLSGNAALAILGAHGTDMKDPQAEPWLERFLFAPGLRLGGGTDEIQRNAIAERGLGLPRDRG